MELNRFHSSNISKPNFRYVESTDNMGPARIFGPFESPIFARAEFAFLVNKETSVTKKKPVT